MQRHEDAATVNQWVCRAIHNLAFGNQANQANKDAIRTCIQQHRRGLTLQVLTLQALER